MGAYARVMPGRTARAALVAALAVLPDEAPAKATRGHSVQVVAGKCGTPGALWSVTPLSNGRYRIDNGLGLALAENTTTWLANLRPWKVSSTQQWQIAPNSSVAFQIRISGDDCLSFDEDYRALGIWTCDGSSDQQFAITQQATGGRGSWHHEVAGQAFRTCWARAAAVAPSRSVPLVMSSLPRQPPAAAGSACPSGREPDRWHPARRRTTPAAASPSCRGPAPPW